MEQPNPQRALVALAALVLSVTTLVACGSSEEEAIQPTTTTALVESTETTGVDNAGRAISASYQSATVYAASTDYYFEDSDGQVVEFRASNLPDEQSIELPDNMLDPDAVEGPPGANPDLVGEEFLLTYDENDQLVRVELSR